MGSRWKTEVEIHAFHNFKAQVLLQDQEYEVHFIELFSVKRGAVPLIMLHGWPGMLLGDLQL